MNQKLTNEEIANVFAMYLRQKVVMIEGNQNFLRTRSWNKGSIIEIKTNTIFDLSMFHSCFKLLLTPLSSITDEDAVQVSKMEMPKAEIDEYTRLDIIGYLTESLYDLTYPTYIYLISKGYAVPLYFAPGHLANGKTAIELGIAIEKHS